MFGPRLSTVFASRWRALWFAASVLVSVWAFIPSDTPDDAGNGAAAQSDVEQAQAALDQLSAFANQNAR